ncbi:MAG: hypothetical protein IT462_07615 [Planctomycetes bacterium]|nr:hypothetical protein [Planctomycetota bacterium]
MKSLEVNLGTDTFAVHYAPAEVSVTEMFHAIEALGYSPQSVKSLGIVAPADGARLPLAGFSPEMRAQIQRATAEHRLLLIYIHGHG